MLKANIDKHNPDCTVVTGGTLRDIINDIAVIVNTIHTEVAAASPEDGKAFRSALTSVLTRPDSAVWSPINHDHTAISIRLPKED